MNRTVVEYGTEWFSTEKCIRKCDIISICDHLNDSDIFKDICYCVPEGVTEGGIQFVFHSPFSDWYKALSAIFSCLSKAMEKSNGSDKFLLKVLFV